MRRYITHGVGLPNWVWPIRHAVVVDNTFIDIALVDLADLPEVNALNAELLAEGLHPARTIYQAATLPFGGGVKVMGVAVREHQEQVPD